MILNASFLFLNCRHCPQNNLKSMDYFSLSHNTRENPQNRNNSKVLVLNSWTGRFVMILYLQRALSQDFIKCSLSQVYLCGRSQRSSSPLACRDMPDASLKSSAFSFKDLVGHKDLDRVFCRLLNIFKNVLDISHEDSISSTVIILD